MSGVNPANERIKRRYYHYVREAEGRVEKTVEHASRAITEYERFTAWKDFKRFRPAEAIGYRRSLLAGDGKRSAQLSSRATVHTKLIQVRKFFRWLAGQPGFKTRIRFADVEFFSLSGRDRKLALERREKPAPSLEQLQYVIRNMPASTDTEVRNRAIVACILLSGARVSAVISLKLKHVRPDRLGIDQDAREVRTKFSKSFPTFFFPVGDDIREIFLAYVDHLQTKLLWGVDDPLFPRSLMYVGSARKFEWVELERRHWATPDPVRDVFRRAFGAAGLPYYSPHSVRRTLTLLGQRICNTPEAMKAWSQNLGHDEVLTTLTSYGAVPVLRQAELIRQAGSDDVDPLAQRVSELVERALAGQHI